MMEAVCWSGLGGAVCGACGGGGGSVGVSAGVGGADFVRREVNSWMELR